MEQAAPDGAVNRALAQAELEKLPAPDRPMLLIGDLRNHLPRWAESDPLSEIDSAQQRHAGHDGRLKRARGAQAVAKV